MQVDQLQGLRPAQLTGPGGPVQFQLRRDAGTFAFEGIIRSGIGAGTFSFTSDPNFPAELAKRGFARPTAAEQYQMARHDVGFAFIDELSKHGYAKPETSELVRAGQHGVRVTYVREMAALGYRLGSLAPVIELRDHGVGPSYVRELADQGYKGLSADELRKARDHGISPEYVRAMRDGGYGSLKMEQLINARDHGVGADYVRDMRQLGYSVPLDELIRARDHGVSVEFVREMATLGYTKLPLDSLIRVRDHGVSPKVRPGAEDARLRQSVNRRPGDAARSRFVGRPHSCGQFPRRHAPAGRSAQVGRGWRTALDLSGPRIASECTPARNFPTHSYALVVRERLK